MGLFTKRKTRADRRAEAKALKHKATLEAKSTAKTGRKKLRAETKSAKKVEKAQLATLKAEEKAQLSTAKAQEKAAAKTGISAAQIRRYLGIARLLTPILGPILYRVAVTARAQFDQQRAQRLGIAAEELGSYTGHGARLSARITSAERTAEEIAQRFPDAETARFTAAVRGRLAELDTAVHAAEQMPAQRRKSAHLAIATELDGVEADLLAKLGVR